MSTLPINELYDHLTAVIIQRVVTIGTIGVDIGAHSGQIIRHIVRTAPHGSHVAVEPIPGLAAGLREQFPTVQVHEVALDAEGGREISFHHVVSNPAYSGLRERRYDRPNETVEIISVRSARLDDLVADGQRVTFVKIDVEGGELGVLQGGLQMLAQQRPVVVFEHGLGASDYYEIRPGDVCDLLVGSGLSDSLLQRFTAGEGPIGRGEFVRQFQECDNFFFVAYPLD
jgi:FkbM family methyltransferase